MRNACIDENFNNRKKITSMVKLVADQCGYDETFYDGDLKTLFDFECGKVLYSSGFAIGGNQTERGQWPFLVALYNVEYEDFFCGGSLITSKHVLTGDRPVKTKLSLLKVIFALLAAHCIQYKHQRIKLTTEKFTVFIGRYNLDVPVERGATARDVKLIIVHPDWKIFTYKWDADLAVLVLNEAVAFTEYIQPICLPASVKIENYDRGTVVSNDNMESTLVQTLLNHISGWLGQKRKQRSS